MQKSACFALNYHNLVYFRAKNSLCVYFHGDLFWGFVIGTVNEIKNKPDYGISKYRYSLG